MSPITNCIKNKDTKSNPIWLMRQAGRYLPEFREIRKENQDFIRLCLNSDLASEITLQPIKRFGFDGAVIFSDILMLPYGLGQNVEFEKNFGPKLGELNLNEINGFTKSIWSGVTTLELAKAVKWSIQNNITGLYHVTNNSSINKYELLNLFKKYTKKNINIKKIDGRDVDKSFIDTRLLMNYKIPSYEKMIADMVDLISKDRKLYSQYMVKAIGK